MPEESASVNRLRTYLNMPMERIPRYKMLLQELLESTSPDHIDYAPLQSAINSMNLVAFKIQEIIARRENVRKIDEISAKVGIDLRGKRFVKEGTLRKVCRAKVQKYYFVLMEDGALGLCCWSWWQVHDADVWCANSGGVRSPGRWAAEEEVPADRSVGVQGVGRDRVDPRGDQHSRGHSQLAKVRRSRRGKRCRFSPADLSVTLARSSCSRSAFYFFSPLKSFILLTESEEEKTMWTSSIRESIARTLRGPTSTRRASIRSELLLNEDDLSNDYELEGAFVIKNGWLNVTSECSRRPQRLWISLTLQNLTFSTAFKAAQPDESISIELCEVTPMREEGFFRLVVAVDEVRGVALTRHGR